jgi:2-polyprenyl-3-methyl-5-hydroxy-6-metoxy-1,4-benzoquinol methylase
MVFLDRANVPVHQNVQYRDANGERNAARGDLKLAACRSCGFVTNLAFQQSLIEYGEGYENDQTSSPTFESHTDARIASLVAFGIRGRFVVDVGCGQGQFLRRLCAAGECSGLGFDPAYTGTTVVDDGRVSFVREFFGGRPNARAPDVVVCRHVIEHVPQPIAFLESLRAGLTPGHPTRLAFETPTVDWILEGTVVQDFFYEHCSYFTPESLGFAFHRAGFSDVHASRVFDGQYIWATAEYGAAAGPSPAMRPAASRIVAAAGAYGEQWTRRGAALVHAVERFGRSGPVAIWGAGAKGVTFLNLIDPECRRIACTVDVNKRKQGKFIAGTGHPIVAPEGVLAREIQTIVAMNPNYADEIRRTVANIGSRADVIVEGEL